MWAATPTLSFDASHAMPTRDDDEDVTWRSLGVDGGVVSAAAAGVDATTDRTRTSAMMAAASIAVFGLPRWRPIARTTVLPRARLSEPADRAGYNARVACGNRTMNSIRGPIQGNGTRFVVTVGSPETLTPSANAVSRARRIVYSSETPRSLRFTRNSYAPRRLNLARAAREPKPAGEPTAGRPTTGGTSITRRVRTLARDDRLPAATRGLRDGHGPAFTDRTSAHARPRSRATSDPDVDPSRGIWRGRARSRPRNRRGRSGDPARATPPRCPSRPRTPRRPARHRARPTKDLSDHRARPRGGSIRGQIEDPVERGLLHGVYGPMQRGDLQHRPEVCCPPRTVRNVRSGAEVAGGLGDRDDGLDLQASDLRPPEEEDPVVSLALVEVRRHLVGRVVALEDQVQVRHGTDGIGRGRAGIEHRSRACLYGATRPLVCRADVQAARIPACIAGWRRPGSPC